MENHFQSRDGAQWVIEAVPIPTGGTMLRYRLSECEAGFRLIRGQASSYTRDKCEMCEFGKLALGRASFDPLHASYGRLDTFVAVPYTPSTLPNTLPGMIAAGASAFHKKILVIQN